MKNKEIIKLVVVIAIIIAVVIVISTVVTSKNKNVKRLYQLYDKLNTSQTYLFEMERDDENKTIMAKKGDKTIIDVYSEEDHRTTIIKDNTTYYILHNREEYYVYNDSVEQTILTDGLSEIISKEFIIGTEKVKGKKYTYEEYQGSTMFMETSSLNVNEGEIKTRFYFDNEDNLAYIRTIKGVNQELLKINTQMEVDDSIFEIPSDYAEYAENQS